MKKIVLYFKLKLLYYLHAKIQLKHISVYNFGYNDDQKIKSLENNLWMNPTHAYKPL